VANAIHLAAKREGDPITLDEPLARKVSAF
jgi:hypothetical protein